jgi:hypothetical protein
VSGERRRVEYVVVRGPARLLAAGVALVAFASLVLLGVLWQWSVVADAPSSVRWLIASAASANMLGGIFAVLAFGMVRS